MDGGGGGAPEHAEKPIPEEIDILKHHLTERKRLRDHVSSNVGICFLRRAIEGGSRLTLARGNMDPDRAVVPRQKRQRR